MKSAFFDHLESFFGSVDKGWKIYSEKNSIQIVKTTPDHLDDSQAFVSLGYSNALRPLREKSKCIRCEFFLILPAEYQIDFVPSIFEDVISMAESEGVFLRGDVIGPKGELFKGSGKTALYVAPPNCFDDEVNEFTLDGNKVVFIWLVPINDREAKYIKKHGWEEFENALEENNVDVIDIFRKSVA